MSLFHMDEKSNKYLHDYAQLLTKHFKMSEQKQFSFNVGIDSGSKEPDADNRDIVTCNISAMVMRPRGEGLFGKDVVITFNAFVEGIEANHLVCARAVGPDFKPATGEFWANGAHFTFNAGESFSASNELILGHFEKLTIPAIAAFNELKGEIADTGFYLYRDGFTPPPDEEDEDE